jgi:hypothetical protein
VKKNEIMQCKVGGYSITTHCSTKQCKEMKEHFMAEKRYNLIIGKPWNIYYAPCIQLIMLVSKSWAEASWEADSHPAWQETPLLQWNPKILYCVRKSQLLKPSQVSWFQNVPSYPIYVRCLSILFYHLCIYLPIVILLKFFR